MIFSELIFISEDSSSLYDDKFKMKYIIPQKIKIRKEKFVTEKQVVKNVILIYHILYDRNPFT